MLQLLTELTIKLIPIYLYGLLGYVIGKTIRLPKDKVADTLIFFIVPVIAFHGAFTIKLSAQALSLPLLFFILCSVIAFLFLFISKKIWSDNTPNLLAFCASYGNFGYFAVPASIILFGMEAESIVIVAGLGFNIFMSTIGYYITARGSFSIKESIIKTLKLPSIYAMIAGFTLNYLNLHPGVVSSIDLNKIYVDVIRDFRGIFTIAGMMLLGIAIAEIKSLKIDWKFTILTFIAQFIAWPMIMIFLIILDKQYFHFYEAIVHKVIFLMALIPVGINVIAFATQLDVQPEKAAVTILFSTLFGMIYIPLILGLFIIYI